MLPAAQGDCRRIDTLLQILYPALRGALETSVFRKPIMLRLLAALLRFSQNTENDDEFSRRSRSSAMWEMVTGVVFFGAGAFLLYWMLFHWL
jgi:hypothetical protein